MNLRRLECFIAVVDSGTVTAAAAQLRVAQPALSRQLRMLEREMGLQLFDRHRNRLQLTATGHEFLRVARDLTVHADSVRRTVLALSTGQVESLVMAATAASITGIVAPFLATLSSADPRIVTREAKHFRINEMLRGGTDFVISPTAPMEDFAHHGIGVVPITAYVSQDHPWAREGVTSVGLADLVRQPLILPTIASVSRVELDLVIARAGLAYGSVAECDEGHTVQALAAAGHGTGVVTDAPRFGAYPVSIRDTAAEGSPPLGVTLHVAWNRRHYGAATIAGLAARLETYLRDREEVLPYASSASQLVPTRVNPTRS